MAETPKFEWNKFLLTTLLVVLAASNVGTFLVMRQSKEAAPTVTGVSPAGPVKPAADLPAVDATMPAYAIINAHDHLYRTEDFEQKYLPAAQKMGIVKTLFVASSDLTIKGKGGLATEGSDANTREILRCAQKYPGKIIPFCTFHPTEPDKIGKLKEYRELGAQGLKLYTGHTNFHDRPLDDPIMEEVYAWCEQEQFPILWHIGLANFSEEFLRVMAKHPKLKVIIPHFGVAFFYPNGKPWTEIQQILDMYPQIMTDTSFGTRDILVSGLEKVTQNVDTFRKFYEKYQDRITWGTDMVVTGNSEKTPAWVEATIRACRDLHEKDTYYFWMAANGSKYASPKSDNPYGQEKGLHLPDTILKKIYETNITKFLSKQ